MSEVTVKLMAWEPVPWRRFSEANFTILPLEMIWHRSQMGRSGRGKLLELQNILNYFFVLLYYFFFTEIFLFFTLT